MKYDGFLDIVNMLKIKRTSKKVLSEWGRLYGFPKCRWYQSKKKYRQQIMDFLQGPFGKEWGEDDKVYVYQETEEKK